MVFRNLKKLTDDAVALFSSGGKEIIFKPPYEECVKKFSQAFIQLLNIAPTVNSVSDLKDENEELEFIKAFRELIRIKNELTTFADFTFNDLSMKINCSKITKASIWTYI